MFPRPTGHALPCSAFNRPPCAAGLDTTRHLRNLAHRGQMGARGLRGFFFGLLVGAVHGCIVFFLPQKVFTNGCENKNGFRKASYLPALSGLSGAFSQEAR